MSSAHLVTLSDVELADWARSHSDEVSALCSRGTRELLREKTPESAPHRRFAEAVAGLRPNTRRADVARVREAWDSLGHAAQEVFVVAYPGVIGPLNGVPFAARIRANTLVAVAALDALERRARVEGRRGVGENRNWFTRMMGRFRALLEPAFVKERRRDLARMLPGFRHAVEHSEPRLRLLLASTAGAGRFVALDGGITEASRSVAVFVPGTMTDGNSLQANMERLRAVDGVAQEPGLRVGVYWAGGEFPRVLTDNADPRFAVGLSRRLAAFDAALDLECASEGATAAQTYIGHSFGGAAIGTAEADAEGSGLTADAVVYAGSPGAGFGITGPQDTVNPEIPRYALVADGDLKPAAGHLLYSRAMGAAPLSAMGVERLSTGFLDHAARAARLRLHDDYLRDGSTSALNIRAVVTGAPVLPWLGKGGSDEQLAARITAAHVPW